MCRISELLKDIPKYCVELVWAELWAFPSKERKCFSKILRVREGSDGNESGVRADLIFSKRDQG